MKALDKLKSLIVAPKRGDAELAIFVTCDDMKGDAFHDAVAVA